MLRVLAFGAAACVMSSLGHLRRAGEIAALRTGEAPAVRSYEFDPRQDIGIIRPALRNDIQQKTPGHIAQEADLDEALKVPLQALIDGAISVRGKRFRSCSDEALDLPDFDINNLVVNAAAEIVGYFDDEAAA